MLRLHVLSCTTLVLSCLLDVSLSKRIRYEPFEIDWDESFESFVPYPEEVARSLDQKSPPVLLEVFSDVDVGEEGLYHVLKGLVHRNERRVIPATHFVIQDGLSAQCRQERVTATTGSNGEPVLMTVTRPIEAENCTLHCTNGGRYCSHASDPNFPGRHHVQEAARRACMIQQHPPSPNGVHDMLLWQYLDLFDQQGCNLHTSDKHHYPDVHNLTECSYTTLDLVEPGLAAAVQQCVEDAGGFDADQENVVLEQQITLQTQQQVNPTAHNPTVRFNGKQYTQDFFVKDVFRAFCDIFPKGTQPFSCNHCQSCSNVRKCLWHLDCDGQTPTLQDYYAHEGRNYTPPATTTATTEAASASTTSGNSQDNNNNLLGGAGPWQIGFLWGIVAGLFVAAVFAYRSFRTRRMISGLRQARVHFEDDFVPHGLSEEDLDRLFPDADQELDAKKHGMSTPQYQSSSIATMLSSDEETEDLSERSLPSIV
ncbi:Vacuolar-sorting receptor [Seminavis robusta]|uniref:Vacuolar-sorting receptor n=1 Tax=Seminavis robusta TaxID=568900 RepID=A0A9N8HGN7_9STRA|nr:Vacuolar-sorting receptor [Seminavis robusta]|eukprot:Sro494_g154260.1 Vacuolar-sorting receptor (481) ;mRNA; r:29932-31374